MGELYLFVIIFHCLLHDLFLLVIETVVILGGFKSFVRFYETTLNCNISMNTYSI